LNQPRCPTADEQIKKCEINIYIYISEDYSAIEKNEIVVCRKMTKLEIIILSKINPGQKSKYHRFSFICGI
jgi:hypothetical protein